MKLKASVELRVFVCVFVCADVNASFHVRVVNQGAVVWFYFSVESFLPHVFLHHVECFFSVACEENTRSPARL